MTGRSNFNCFSCSLSMSEIPFYEKYLYTLKVFYKCKSITSKVKNPVTVKLVSILFKHNALLSLNHKGIRHLK